MATMVPSMWTWRSASNTGFVDYDDMHDSWSPYTENVANAGVGFGMYFMFVHFNCWEWLSMIIVWFIQFMWQAKSALVPYNNYDAAGVKTSSTTYMGGFGYSWKQEIYGAGGVFLAFLLDVMWPPAIQPSKEGDHQELEGDEDMEF